MPRLMTFASLVSAALALCACGGPEPRDPPSPPDTASNFAQPFDARGANPDWGLTIRGNQLTLTRAGRPDLSGTAPGAAVSDHAASWTVSLPDGQTMKASLYASPCAEALSGKSYAYAAEVILPDKASLEGCAGPPSKP